MRASYYIISIESTRPRTYTHKLAMCSVLVRLMLLLLLRSLTVCVCFNRVYECHTVNACLEYSAFLRWIWLCVCFVSVLRSADIFIIARANTFWSFAPKNARTLAHSHTLTHLASALAPLFFLNIIRLNSVTTEVARAVAAAVDIVAGFVIFLIAFAAVFAVRRYSVQRCAMRPRERISNTRLFS